MQAEHRLTGGETRLEQVALFFVVAVIGARTTNEVRRGRAAVVVVSTVAAASYIFFLWIPAILQSRGLLRSKIDEAGVLSPPSGTEIDSLALRWSLELVVVVVAEMVGSALVASRLSKFGKPRRNWIGMDEVGREAQWLRTANVLILVGFLAHIVFPSPDLLERAGSGNGVTTLLRSCMVLGLSIHVYLRSYRRAAYLIVLCLGLLYIVSSGVRSPLLIVFFAYVASAIQSGVIRRVTFWLRAACLGISVALVGAFMSIMRANIIRGHGLSLSEIMTSLADNWWRSIYEAGIDTLDGYRFATAVEPFTPGRPADLLNVVLTFIPRSIWPDKPSDIVVDLSGAYLGYESSGQFLSPVGYLTVVLDGYIPGLVGLFTVAVILAAINAAAKDSYWFSLSFLTVFRFFLSGSSFDLYYGLASALPVFLVLRLVQLLSSRVVDPSVCARPSLHGKTT